VLFLSRLSPPVPKPTPKEVQLLQLKEFLELYYFEPDIQALTVALSIYCAHTSLQDDPVWSFFVGPSGGQKTSVVIRGLSFLPNTHLMDCLGIGTFLSGYSSKGGILQRIKNGVFLFPDFSVFLGLKAEVRTQLQAQLRSIYEGRLVKEVGSTDTKILWEGKVSIVAACTEAIERYWGFGRDLGERFLTSLMSPISSSDRAMDMAIDQIGMEADIARGFSYHINSLVDTQSLSVIPRGKSDISQLKSLCKLAAELRRNVHREGNEITAVYSPEQPTRLIKALISLARGHAMLLRKSEVGKEDITLAKEICLSTIPQKRLMIIRYLLNYPSRTASQDSIIRDLKIPRSTTKKHLEDLLACEILQVSAIKLGVPDLSISAKLIPLTKEVTPLYPVTP